MKKNIIMIIVLFFGINHCFGQEQKDWSKTPLLDWPVYVMKLSNGTEKITRVPIYIGGKQTKGPKQLIISDFLEQHPNVKATSAYIYIFYPEVKRVFSLTDIFDLFKIKNKYRDFEVEVDGYPRFPVPVQKSIYATENSIESVKVDESKKKVIIKKHPDQKDR